MFGFKTVRNDMNSTDHLYFHKVSSVSLCLLTVIAMQFCQPAFAEESDQQVIPPATERFASLETDEIPDFQKHLIPVLSHLGCNGRACHGAFQGRGDFALSLFGYDFDLDHKGLIDRVDPKSPADSYAIQKATLQEDHEGGHVLQEGSWEYHLFMKWIEGGAKWSKKPSPLASLEVTPREIVYDADGQTQPLKAIAVWEDGTREDVTCLTRFQSNDDAVCTIDASGVVTSVGPGDSHVVAFYDSAVVPIPVMRPIQKLENYPAEHLTAKTPIDRAVVNKLQKLGIVPSDVCDDSEFLRRVSLDLTGTLPNAQEVRDFLQDTTLDKRARKVDELLQTPAYAAWWTNLLCDWTGCSDEQLANIIIPQGILVSKDWYKWIYKRVADNVSYDEIVRLMVLSEGRLPDESFFDYSERMCNTVRKDGTDFSENESMMYFWGRRNFNTPGNRAIGFSYAFMGTRIQCAECHKHPFDVWTKNDFDEFQKFFRRVSFARNGNDREAYDTMIAELELQDVDRTRLTAEMDKLFKEGKTVPFAEVAIAPPRYSDKVLADAKKAEAEGKKFNYPKFPARLLGGESMDLNQVEDPRTVLMDWLLESPTQLFAKAFVNRVWANYFNRGIVEPTDDLSMANPPCNEELMNYLVQGFIEHGYDMKWLHREICLSDTYQRSWRANDTNLHDERNFSRAVPRRLPAETVFDAFDTATANDERARIARSELDKRAIASSSPPRRNTQGKDLVLQAFGRSTRQTNCDCDRSMEASLLQTIFARNDTEVMGLINRRDGWLEQFDRETRREAERIRKRKEAQEAKQAKEKQEAADLSQTEPVSKVDESEKQKKEQPKKQDNNRPARRLPPRILQPYVDEAYLRTLSRYPTEAEMEIALEHIKDSNNVKEGMKDLIWALINTKEFIVNH